MKFVSDGFCLAGERRRQADDSVLRHPMPYPLQGAHLRIPLSEQKRRARIRARRCIWLRKTAVGKSKVLIKSIRSSKHDSAKNRQPRHLRILQTNTSWVSRAQKKKNALPVATLFLSPLGRHPLASYPHASRESSLTIQDTPLWGSERLVATLTLPETEGS
eukprot:s1393_g6.t1